MPNPGGWASCDVVRAGAAEEDAKEGKKSTIYIRLRYRSSTDMPKWDPPRWYKPVEATKRDMLATALSAMSTGLPVDVNLASADEYSTLHRLYMSREA